MNIKKVEYIRDVKKGEGVEYLENVITFDDGTTAVRNGIIRVDGNTIAQMTINLKRTTRKNGWWSLQATSVRELKAAYFAGFRNESLLKMKDHLEKFKKAGTIHVQKKVSTGGNNS